MKKYFILFVFFFVLAVHVNANESLIDHIKSGRSFWVVFDETYYKFDDSRFTGDCYTDPLGQLNGKGTYEIIYKDAAKEWIVTGPSSSTPYNSTARYPNSKHLPDDYKLEMWGRAFTFTEGGKVIDTWVVDQMNQTNPKLTPDGRMIDIDNGRVIHKGLGLVGHIYLTPPLKGTEASKKH